MSATYLHTGKSSSIIKYISRFVTVGYWLGVLAMLVYLWAFTWNQYSSISAFRVSREESSGMDAGLAQLVLPGLGSTTAADVQLAVGYINSSDLLLELENEFGLRQHFSQPTRDWFFRLEADASLEDRLEFYRKQITTHFTPEAGQTTLCVRTFDPVLSKKIADSILKRAEKFVNEVNQQVADQQLGFVHQELERAINHVHEVNAQIISLQNRHGFIDPDQAINVALAAVNGLHAKRIDKESELATLLRDAPESPKIPNLRSELRSIEELMAMEMAKLSGPEQDKLNQILIEFRNLQQKLVLATQLRTSAEVLLEKKRIETIASTRFFSVIQTPYHPEEEDFPRRSYATSAIIVLGFLGYLILRAIIHSVTDRA